MANAGELSIGLSVEGFSDVAKSMQRLRGEVQTTATTIKDQSTQFAVLRQNSMNIVQALSDAAAGMRETGAAGAQMVAVLDTAAQTIRSAGTALQSLKLAAAGSTAAMLGLVGLIPLVVVGLLRLEDAAGKAALRLDTLGVVLRWFRIHLGDGVDVLQEHTRAMLENRAAQETQMQMLPQLTHAAREHAVSYADIATGANLAKEAIERIAEQNRRAAAAAAAHAKALRDAAAAAAEVKLQRQINELVAFNIAVRAWWEENAARARDAFLALPAPISAAARELEAFTKWWNRLNDIRRGPAFADITPQLEGETRAWFELSEEFGRVASTAQTLARVNRQVAIDFLEGWLQTARMMGKVTPEIEAEIKKLITAIGGADQGGAWDALMAKLTEGMEKLRNLVVEKFGALGPLIFDVVQGIGGAVGTLFSDLVSGAKSLGEAIANFFSNLANSILNVITRLITSAAVSWLFSLILGIPFGDIFFGLTGLRFAKGGIVPGQLTPIAGFQAGGLVRRPTLAMVGEGGPETIVPGAHPELLEGRRGWREREQREIVIKNYVVFDPDQIPRPGPDEIISVVTLDLRTGGPTAREVRALAR